MLDAIRASLLLPWQWTNSDTSPADVQCKRARGRVDGAWSQQPSVQSKWFVFAAWIGQRTKRKFYAQ